MFCLYAYLKWLLVKITPVFRRFLREIPTVLQTVLKFVNKLSALVEMSLENTHKVPLI